jgi:AraC family transcriptional regulator
MTSAQETILDPMRFEIGQPMLIAGLAERYTFDRRAAIAGQWARFAPYIGAVDNQIGAAALGAISFREDGYDYMTGVHVWDADGLPAGFSVLRIPARRYAVFAHEEPVSSLPSAVQAILHDWLPRSGLALTGAPEILEVYGERFNLTAGKGDIEVWVAVGNFV